MLNVEFTFEFYCGETWPELSLGSSTSNLTTTDLQLSKYTKSIIYTFNTADKIVFKNTNKKESDTVVHNGSIIRDQYVKLISVRVDNILLDYELIKPYIVFHPQYTQGYLSYCNQNNIVPAETTFDSAIYFNGDWDFNFVCPFWQWYAGLKQEQILKHFSSKDIEMYFGVNNNENQILLAELKTLIKTHV